MPTVVTVVTEVTEDTATAHMARDPTKDTETTTVAVEAVAVAAGITTRQRLDPLPRHHHHPLLAPPPVLPITLPNMLSIMDLPTPMPPMEVMQRESEHIISLP